MKKNYTLLLLTLVAVFFAGAANAQISRHPLAFYGIVPNFYKDYVGMKLQVTAPTSIARDYEYTTSNDGSGSTANWGGYLTTPLVNVPVAMALTDTFVCSTLPAGSMAGKIALIWRGTCEFSAKAYEAQLAGAVAAVIINSTPGEGPLGMAAGAMGAYVTIPVYMIGNIDGIGISSAYHAAPGTVTMSITPWSKGLQNDLGFVPGGASLWHNGAIPSFQIPSTEPSPKAYKGLSGAFIGNYGNLTAHHVKLKSSLKFTPTGGSSAVVHADTISMTPATFPTTDSIWALFGSEYNLPGVTGTGKFDLTYTITSDSVDNFPGDNTTTHTFYATDSVFSKGRYDVVNNHPIATYWTGWGTTPTLWGVPYFVKHGACAAFKDIQFSASTGPGPITGGSSTDFHVFKWVPSSINDSTMEQPELTEIGYTSYSYTSADSSFEYFTTPTITDFAGNQLQLEDSTWYYIAVDMGLTPVALGCDGEISGLPRTYGRSHVSGYHDLYQALFPFAASDLSFYPTQPSFAFPGGGGIAGNLNSADSAYFRPQKGLIPALALRVTPFHPVAGTIISPPTALCVGDTIGITVFDTSIHGTWTASGSAVSIFPTTYPAIGMIAALSAGTATISYSVSACGGAVATTIVTVNSADAGTIAGPSNVCVGSSVTLTDAATGGSWAASNSNVTISGGAITGVAAGTTTISYNVSNICGTGTATHEMTVNALPVPAITVSGGTLSTGSYATYQWYVGTTTQISGATNSTYEALTNGLYQVTVTDANGCTGSSAVNVTTVGVDNLYNTGNISIYPNPAKSVLNIVGTDNVSVKMYNAVGQVVKEVSKANSIKIADLAAGIYFVKVFNEQGEVIYYNKIVKE